MQIIVKTYEHFNRSMPGWDTPKGVHVKSKDHYDRLMKENGMITHEEAARRLEKDNLKPYKVSNESLEIIKAAKSGMDRKGNVKLSDTAIKALIDKKAIRKYVPDYMQLPSAYSNKGGFS